MLRFSTEAAITPAAMAEVLLEHYDRQARILPWRSPPGSTALPDPYGVWLSEVMLQQTTVAAVIPYYQTFLDRWPTVFDLAAAPVEDVLAAWAGLGYYARARNLHKCAQVVAGELGGRFPGTAAELARLPGIGPYTAAAIAAIAFGEAATVVDGNVERVIARIFAVDTPLPDAKAELRQRAAELTPASRPGDYAQAIMDLGATICTPRRPKCLLCPWKTACAAHAAGAAEDFPRRATPAEKPQRDGMAWWLEAPHPQSGDPAVLLVRRPARGLLGGMRALPSHGWDGSEMEAFPEIADFEAIEPEVRHVFTHFTLHLRVVAARIAATPVIEEKWPDAEWWPLADLDDAGLPSLMRKAARAGLAWSRSLS